MPLMEVKVPSMEVKVRSMEVEVSSMEVEVSSMKVKVALMEVEVPLMEVKVPSMEVKVQSIAVKVPSMEVKVPLIRVQPSSWELSMVRQIVFELAMDWIFTICPRRSAAESLDTIDMTKEMLIQVVRSLRHHLRTTEAYELMMKCAETMPYKDFFQAFHSPR